MLINKFNQITYKLIKNTLNCFVCFNDNRTFEGSVYFSNSSFYLTFGNMFLLKVAETFVMNTFFLKATFFNCFFLGLRINRLVFKKFTSDVFILIRRAYYQKNFVKGRFLNTLKGGFAIGICGFVGFLPKMLCAFSIIKTYSVYFVQKFDLIKKVFTLSQKSINKLTSRVLFKLNLYVRYKFKN